METNTRTPEAIFYPVVHYEIPAFQRRYIWNQDEQWEPLWDDVSAQAEAIISEESGQANRHFMGAIVLQQRPTGTGSIETRIVVDGQQRLTTLQLLIDAVQEVCQQNGHHRAADNLKLLVENPESRRRNGNLDDAFKVWPTINDREAFRQAMRNDLSSDEFKNSRIVAAHDYFKNQTEQWLQGYPEEDNQRSKAAEALDLAVRDCLELVVIDLGQADKPNIIFETLNARGTPLLPSDMIKNLVLHKAGLESDEDEKLPEAAAQLWGFSDDWWGQEIGRGYQRRPRIDIYLNNWLTLRNLSETRADKEFEEFSEYVKKHEKAGGSIHSIAGDIGRLASIYRDIDQLKVPEIEQFLYRRQVMGIGVITPVLLWLLSSEVPGPQFSKSITALESYLVRRMVCGMSARTYGQIFVQLLKELERSGPETAGDTVVRYLGQQEVNSSLWPDDQSLLETFATSPLYSSLTRGRLNLILQGIEGELRARSMAETQTVPGGLSIEHIMPQAWQRHWPLPGDTADEERSRSRNRLIQSIGNLTLVTQRLNSALSNAPWEQKRETLAQHSTLFLNKILLDNAPAVWDEAAIAGRAERLHQAAVRVWPHANAIP